MQAARSEDDARRLILDQRPAFRIEAQQAGNASVRIPHEVHEGDALVDMNAAVDNRFRQRLDECFPCPSLYAERPGVAAEVALDQFEMVSFEIKLNAELHQIFDAFGSLVGKHSHELLIDEAAAGSHRVLVMALAAVVAAAESSSAHAHDFAGAMHGAAARLERRLREQPHVGAGLPRRERRSTRRSPAAHDHHVGRATFERQSHAATSRATMLRRISPVPPKIWNTFASRKCRCIAYSME